MPHRCFGAGFVLALVCLPVLLLANTTRPRSSEQGPAANDPVVDMVADAVTNEYVDPEMGRRIADHLRERAAAGAYRGAATPSALADMITRDLRALNGDKHLSFTYDPARAGADAGASGQGDRAPAGAGGPQRVVRAGGGGPTAEQIERHRRRNFYIERADRLEGNVGYLEVTQLFGQTPAARAAAAAAMEFLTQTDAMIIDLRHAPGGDAGMVDFLASYFVGPEPVETMSSFFRPTGETTTRTTLREIPGRRRPDVPLYVLTSRGTASAAEDLTFFLQQSGRATIVGETTAGAGNPNANIGLGGGWSLSVSIGRSFYPKNGKGWEGVGITPDVACPPDEAVFAAHRAALNRLAAAATDEALARELTWTREALEASHTPIAIPAARLAAFAGRYGERTIVVENARLYYQRSADRPRIALVALAQDGEFALPQAERIAFITRSGAIASMTISSPDGKVDEFARTGQ